MSAFYLEGVSPLHVTLRQIFAGMMPYMFIVLLCLVFMYAWPGMTLRGSRDRALAFFVEHR
jgi:TRAP-type mannitol/chloroaromatic compound transport system permease large subunit